MKISIDNQSDATKSKQSIIYYNILMVEAGGKADEIIFSPNNTLNCILDIKDANYQIDFAVENCLRRALGFHVKIYIRGRHDEYWVSM